jgi:hypothetical protein
MEGKCVQSLETEPEIDASAVTAADLSMKEPDGEA